MSKYLIVIISFFLESAFSSIFYKDTLLLNLFTLLSLYVVYPFFKNNKKNYYIMAVILGFIYDLVFMPNFGINFILFTIFSFTISKICDNFEETFFSNIFTSLLIIISYRLMTYLIYIIFNNLNFDILVFLTSIYSSIILNLIYIIILYFLLRKKKSKL